MIRLWLALIFIFIFSVPARAADITGKVVAIADGDTVTVITPEKKQVKVRLSSIDAPEKAMPFGNQSKKSLSDMVFGKTVRVIKEDTDRYGRIVGRIYVGELDVNRSQVERGMAWVYRQYNRDASLVPVEAEAKENGRGLWADKHPVAPWDYRRGSKVKSAVGKTQVRTAPAAAGGFTCADKRFCKEMASCAEARYYLERCGLSRLDGDGNGVPCEDLCR